MTTQAKQKPTFRVQKRVRRECEACGEPATKCLTFLLKGDRRNPASSAYGRDDCSRCSDAERFACGDCEQKVEREGVEGMSWCGTYSCPAHEHLMFVWKHDESTDRILTDLVEALEGMVVALREQVVMARACGGDIAVNEGNAAAWDAARAALAKAEPRGERT